MSRLIEERYAFDVETFDDDWERTERERREIQVLANRAIRSGTLFEYCLAVLFFVLAGFCFAIGFAIRGF